MAKQAYVAPVLEEIGGFREVTNGYPWWDYRDLFGGHTFISP
ncbi:lasso RiPP family leader peptide-containing protein [Microbispora rosea]